MRLNLEASCFIKILGIFSIFFILNSCDKNGEILKTEEYSVKIDSKWSVLNDKYIHELEQKTPEGQRNYILGYSLEDDFGRTPPYFIMNFYYLDDNSSRDLNVIIDINLTQLSKSGFGDDFLVQVNEEGSRFYVEFEGELGWVFNGYLLAANGIMYFTYVSPKDAVANNKNDFLQIFNSIEFEEKF